MEEGYPMREQIMRGATRVARGAAASGMLSGQDRPVPLKDRAYEVIRHHIITCHFAPGEKLNELQIGEVLGLSRAPVRHALARLRLEGLVTIRPRKGVEVRPIDPAELLQIIDARIVNECHAARLAAGFFTAADSAAMEAILADTESALASRDTEKMMLLDRRFHGVIAQASGNPILREILGNLNDRAIRFWFISLDQQEHQENVLHDHRAIHAALARHDAKAAEEAVSGHIEAFRRNVMMLIGG
jgi:DNA-binding GntR family transcriptional regulator